MIPTSGKGKTMKTIKRSVTAGVRGETLIGRAQRIYRAGEKNL